jgi:hypothetical protein
VVDKRSPDAARAGTPGREDALAIALSSTHNVQSLLVALRRRLSSPRRAYLLPGTHQIKSFMKRTSSNELDALSRSHTRRQEIVRRA